MSNQEPHRELTENEAAILRFLLDKRENLGAHITLITEVPTYDCLEALNRMTEEGLVASRLEGGGYWACKPRLAYKITDKGHAAFAQWYEDTQDQQA